MLQNRPTFAQNITVTMVVAPHVFVFRTNISTQIQAQDICTMLEQSGCFLRATVDLLDDDRVLRVVSDQPNILEVQRTVSEMGFFIEELD
jgi:hypothetical protein